MMLTSEKYFLSLVRLGIGHYTDNIIKEIDWSKIKALSERHGLSAVVLDGIEELPTILRPSQELLLEWIGEVMQSYEFSYEQYTKTISELAHFYKGHGYKMMVLKGYACSLDWPKPSHRPCGDVDIWLFGQQKEADAILAREKGIKVDTGEHHHTTYYWGDFMVENHYDFINTHRHYSHQGLEQIFKELGQDDSHFVEVKSKSTGSVAKVYIPSPNLHALFLIRHALNHFASIGINLRQVLDWAFFAEKHSGEIDWQWLKGVLEKYHMMDFYNCLNAICVDDLGFSPRIFHGVQFNPGLKDRVLNDILSPEYTVENCLASMLKRWKANRWKHQLCFDENAWAAFWYGVWSHLLKPKTI